MRAIEIPKYIPYFAHLLRAIELTKCIPYFALMGRLCDSLAIISYNTAWCSNNGCDGSQFYLHKSHIVDRKIFHDIPRILARVVPKPLIYYQSLFVIHRKTYDTKKAVHPIQRNKTSELIGCKSFIKPKVTHRTIACKCVLHTHFMYDELCLS